MPLNLKARIEAGLGLASKFLPAQLPKIIEQFPELDKVYQGGSINIRLEHNLIIAKPDFTTTPIYWDVGTNKGTEAFSFLKCRIKVTGQWAEAWFYIPLDSPHRADFSKHEIISTKLPVASGMQIEIEIDRQFIRLPYSYNRAYII